MKGDFSRVTFDPDRRYSRVLLQQGRVQVDADWNEQQAIVLNYLRALARDVIGRHGGPTGNVGFEIFKGDPTKPPLKAKVDALKLEASRLIRIREKLSDGDLLIGVGRYYVNGLLAENTQPLLYSEQPGYDEGGHPTIEELKSTTRKVVFYLDVWERHVTYVQDETIREVALDGPDTCTRAQIVWQVRALLEPEEPGPDDPPFTPDLIDGFGPVGTGRLRARANPPEAASGACVIAPDSRYRGAENQLYRVEVHAGGKAVDDDATATFKWSRENGSVIFPIRTLSGTTAIVEHLGKDTVTGLRKGDWVEVVDDGVELGDRSGTLALVEEAKPDEKAVHLWWPKGTSGPPAYSEEQAARSHALLRRWDHAGTLDELGGALAITESDDKPKGRGNGWINLEDGVQVSFAKGGDYRAGDYWLIPARYVTGDVEWPPELDDDGLPRTENGKVIPRARWAYGTRHAYAPLALWDGAATPPATECRRHFDPSAVPI